MARTYRNAWAAFILLYTFLLLTIGQPAYAAPELTVGNYQLVSSTRISRTEFEYTYKADIINSGSGASAVTAKLSSNAPGVTVLDDEISFGDVPANASVTSSDVFSVRHDRTYIMTEKDLIWDIQMTPLEEPITLAIDAPKRVSFVEGETKNTSYTVSLKTKTQQTVVLVQEIIPENEGLVFVSDAPGTWQSEADMDRIVNGTISGSAVGIYTLKITASLQGSDIEAVAEIIVEVESSDPITQVFVGPPDADPDGIPVDTPVTIDFSVQVNSGAGSGAPDSVVLQAVDHQGVVLEELGELFDDGQNGDLVENDSMYGGSFLIPASSEGKLYFRAVAWFGAQSVLSELGSLTVTPFPTDLTPSDPATLIESDDPDQRIFSDQIIVAFEDETPSSVIAATVADVGGAIIGSIPSLNIFQIGFASPKTLSELKSLVSAYAAQPNVEFAELAAETTTTAVYPNDPSKGSQKNMQVSRVDEVWLLNAGGNTIAIVDTGVDYNHDDLDVAKGKNFVSWFSNDPMDKHGHGTHVAGIAAARINDGKGVAGVVNSKILAVKGLLGTDLALARAIKWAAGKATVVNISGGSYSSKSTFEKVTKSLGAKVIVSTAGNHGKNKERYPCANTNVFCVGNSTDDDKRAPSSNYGSWVDIAAPGLNITSTKLGGGLSFYADGGTSSAAPLVAGAARLIWNAHPGWTASKVKQRLLDTAVKAPGLAGKQIGDRIDVFEAFFNGDFEIGTKEWSFVGTCETKASLGPVKPTKGKAMMFCSTGPAGDQVAATLSKVLEFQANSNFTIRFDYNFLSEEYPEWVGSIFDDNLSIKLAVPDGSEILLVYESVNSSSFSLVDGLVFSGASPTVGQTGWKSVCKTIPVTKGEGSYKLIIQDVGDDIFDSAFLLDNIRLENKPCP